MNGVPVEHADREVFMKVIERQPTLMDTHTWPGWSFLKIPSWCVLLLLIAAPLAHAQEDEYETFMKQARLYIKKGWYRDAVKELRRATSTDEGRKSFEAHFLLAQSCFKEYDIGCSVSYAEKSRGVARTPDEKQRAEGMMEYLSTNFGKVEFQAGPGELSEGYLELKPKEPMLDKDVKAYYREKVEPLVDQRRTLPWIMYLPAITWELYGQTFSVEGGREQVVLAGFNAVNAKPKPPRKAPPQEFKGVGLAAQLRVGAGAALLNGGSMNLSPILDVSVHKTLGSTLAVGAFVRGNLLVPGLNPSLPSALIPISAGPIATYQMPLSETLSLMPALGYGVGNGPVKELTGCVMRVEGNQEVLDCTGKTPGSSSAVINTLAHGPLLRMEAAYKKASKSSIFMAYAGAQSHLTLSSVGSIPTTPEGVTIEVTSPGAIGRALRLEVVGGVNLTF